MEIVVGAGFAGLNAAATLVEAGRDVRVIEARGRVGGRVFSRTLPNGAVIEMGAEFILPGNTYIRERADQLGLGLWDKGVRYGRRQARGGPAVGDQELSEALALLEDTLATEPGATQRPAAALLAELAITEGAREYILCRAEISSASSAETVPAGNLLGVAHVDDLPSPSIAGGNQELARALAERIGDERILFDSPVRRIVVAADGVRVRSAAGEIGGDGVVVAVPASVLSEIEFDPGLGDRQAAAFDAVRYGEAAKLFVPLDSPAAPAAVMSMPERYWSWTATGAGGEPQPVVSAFAGSARALRGLGVDAGADRWLASLRELRPELRMRTEGAVLSTWNDDPWVGGAYSVAPGPAVTQSMIAPNPRVEFAGEHTAGELSGLMEGALRSGREAARRLLARSG
jgi:monoamine oxidase